MMNMELSAVRSFNIASLQYGGSKQVFEACFHYFHYKIAWTCCPMGLATQPLSKFSMQPYPRRLFCAGPALGVVHLRGRVGCSSRFRATCVVLCCITYVLVFFGYVCFKNRVKCWLLLVEFEVRGLHSRSI